MKKIDCDPYEFKASVPFNSLPLWDGKRLTYPEWKKRMTIFIQAQDIELWKVIIHGPYVIKDCHGFVKKEIDYTNDDWKKVHINSKSMHLLLCSLDGGALKYVPQYESAQEIWKKLERNYEDYIANRYFF